MKKRGRVMKGCELFTDEVAEACKKRARNHFKADGEEIINGEAGRRFVSSGWLAVRLIARRPPARKH